MKVGSNFIDMCVVVQLSQHHCWRDSPSPLYFLVSIVNWPYMCVFIFGLFIQFHRSTCLFVPIPYCFDCCSSVIMSHNPLFGFKQFARTPDKTQRNILLTGSLVSYKRIYVNNNWWNKPCRGQVLGEGPRASMPQMHHSPIISMCKTTQKPSGPHVGGRGGGYGSFIM